MSESRVVIFEAPSIDAAYRLRSALDREGIPAVVLACCQPAAGDARGRPVGARVAVDPQHAEPARHIVRVWERTAPWEAGEHRAEAGGWATGVSAVGRAAEDIPPGWPRCPECLAPRLTWCPICQTAGTRFEAADVLPPELFDQLGTDVYAAECSESVCARSPCGRPVAGTDNGKVTAARDEASKHASEALGLLLCPTCDEPFMPAFTRHCEWCGHAFADGTDFTPTAAYDGESLGPQAVAVIVGLAVLGALLLGYVLYLL